MTRIDDFFKEMSTHFLESDMDSFNEIKEDLLEHIEIQLEEGKTEAEILIGLGEPEAIAASFYEDQRLDKALKAETDIIAVEDVKMVYKKDRKIKRKKFLRKVQLGIYLILAVVFSCIALYLLSFVAVYAVSEQFLAAGPASLAIFFICGSIYFILFLTRKKVVHTKEIAVLSVVSLLVSLGIFVSGQWFYEGKYYEKVVELNDLTSKETIFSSHYPVEVTTIQIGENEKPKVEIEGHFRKSDQGNFVKESKNKTAIQIGAKDSFGLLKRMKKTEVIFYLPEKTSFENVTFNVNQGTVILSHLMAKKLAIQVEAGDLRLSDIYANEVNLTSEKAGVTINGFYADIQINNHYGKSIVKEGQGTLNVASKFGLINLSDLTSKSTTISNEKGKNVISSSAIDLLKTSNNEGITIIENQTGETKITNNDGKMVLTDLQGVLELKNQNGQVIVYEKDPLNATVTSEKGIVKWVQNYNSAVTFDLSSKSGKISNDFNNQTTANHHVVIKTESGDIRIIEKN